MLQKKLLPLLMSGVTFHFSLLSNYFDVKKRIKWFKNIGASHLASQHPLAGQNKQQKVMFGSFEPCLQLICLN